MVTTVSTDYVPGDWVALSATKIGVCVTDDPRAGRHSFETVADDHGDAVLVYAVAGQTFFDFDGERYLLHEINAQGLPDDEMGKSAVELVEPGGFPPEADHPLFGVTADEFASMLDDGRLKPATDPDSTHD